MAEMIKKIAFMDCGVVHTFNMAILNEISFDIKNESVNFNFIEVNTKKSYSYDIFFGIELLETQIIAASAFLWEAMTKYEYLTVTKGIVTEKGLETIVNSMVVKYNKGAFDE